MTAQLAAVSPVLHGSDISELDNAASQSPPPLIHCIFLHMHIVVAQYNMRFSPSISEIKELPIVILGCMQGWALVPRELIVGMLTAGVASLVSISLLNLDLRAHTQHSYRAELGR